MVTLACCFLEILWFDGSVWEGVHFVWLSACFGADLMWWLALNGMVWQLGWWERKQGRWRVGLEE